MKLETLDLDPQSNTLPGISVVGFHGELTPDQTPARSQPIWVDGNNRMISLVEPGRLRRHADLAAPLHGKLWIERISEVVLASSGPLPGVGTRIGPWTPARPAWIVATLGPRELNILSSLRVDDSNHPRVDEFLLWLGWLAAGEDRSELLHCQRDGQLVHWYCAAADELELRRRIRMVAENALVTDARAQAPAQLQKTSFWLARAATRDEDIYRAAAGLAYPTGEGSPRVDSLLGMLTRKYDTAERQRHFAEARSWLLNSIAALKRQDNAISSRETKNRETQQRSLAAMELSEDQRKHLRVHSTTILEALETVSDYAAALLQQPGLTNAETALAYPSNAMTGGGRDAISLTSKHEQIRQSLRRILNEPFTARIVVRWDDDTEKTYYVTKAAASAVSAGITDLALASYVSPMGRVAELEVGRSATVGNREFEVLERTLLRPLKIGPWDATAEILEFEEWHGALESLRRFLERGGAPPTEDELDILAQIRAEGDRTNLVRSKMRRRVIDRISLRDQPALDQFQGDVFRMPLNRQLILLGPPGSGKTTTLIQRLAAKRNPDGLSDDEESLLDRSNILTRFRTVDSWVMYSPTELLQLYLRDAFNREQVPASPTNLRTWERERQDLARNVFGILRTSADSGGFELDASARNLCEESSSFISIVHDQFVEYSNRMLVDRITLAFEALSTSDDAEIRSATSAARRIVSRSPTLDARDLPRLLIIEPTLRPLLARVRKEAKIELDAIGNRLLRTHRSLLDELIHAGIELRAAARDDDEDEESVVNSGLPRTHSEQQAVAAEILLSSLRTRAQSLARGRKQLSGRSARVFEILGGRAPNDASLLLIGAKLVLATELNALLEGPKRSVLSMAALYRTFRSSNPDLFVEGFDRSKISDTECDVLLLAALRASAKIFEHDRRRLSDVQVPGWIDSIQQRFIIQVFVDEATDFSAVQLACMLLITHPSTQSWFACGDFRQRITPHGLQTRDELHWIARTANLQAIEEKELSIGYRQSHQLRDLTAALEGSPSVPLSDAPASENEVEVVRPILAEYLQGESLADWLGEKIGEIEIALGHLPSIAIFVDGDNQVDDLVARVQQRLSRGNISIVGCKEGRVVGNQQEVRVFDVKHIKGLEFEAVFFVGIDHIYRRIPALFERYIYVGATRAATYLGLTSEGDLPQPLERVRSYFAASWT